jgi:predicted PurR-regulated permease PerM
MTPTSPLPFYAKISLLLVGGYIFVSILSIAGEIILPFTYAVIISILLNPIVNFLVKKKFNRLLAITIAIVITFLFTAGLVYIVANQMGMFGKSFPKMEQRFGDLLNQTASWISDKFHISHVKVNAWIARTRNEIINNGNAMIGRTLLTLTSILIVVILIPVYVFMILYYKPLLLAFLRQLFEKSHQEKVEEVLMMTKGIIQSYISGLLIEAVIISTMNSLALIILGIDYAILLGIVGALLNVIPLIGGILAVILPIIVALVTKDSPSSAFLVLISYMLIQSFDNHYITPKIVASKVKINALMAVVVVLLGNALWGVPGMFLAIPLAGIVKVIFEHIDNLKPWGYLLGDTMPVLGKFKIMLPKRKQKINPFK